MANAIARTDSPAVTSVTRLSEGARAWFPIAAIVVVFVLVSTTYNILVPLYEAPDEAAHTHYAELISERGALPRFQTRAEYQSWQPPLYYAVGALVLKAMALHSPPELALNSAFPGQANNYTHATDEDFPYSPSVLTVHVLRAINTLFSTGTVIIIYLTALFLFPFRRLLALTAALSAAFIPQFVFISATVSNDPSSVFAASACVYFGLRLLHDGRQLWLVLAALALSVCALTKLTAVVTGVVPLGALLLNPGPARLKARQMAMLAIIPLVLSGWFYIRSLILWGAIFPAHLFWPMEPRPIWDEAYRSVVLEDLRNSFWYAGGAANLHISPILYDILDIISVLGLGGVIAIFRRGDLSRFQAQGLLLMSFLPFLALASILYFSMTYAVVSQGRYLFVAMPTFAIMLPLGLSTLFSRNSRDSISMLALPAFLLALNIGIFAITIPGAY